MLSENLKNLILNPSDFVHRRFSSESEGVKSDKAIKLHQKFILAKSLLDKSKSYREIWDEINTEVMTRRDKGDMSEKEKKALKSSFENNRQVIIHYKQIQRLANDEYHSSPYDIAVLLIFLEVPYEEWKHYLNDSPKEIAVIETPNNEPSTRFAKVIAQFYKIPNRVVSKQGFQKGCIWGGATAGFLGALIILILYTTHHKLLVGYENLDFPKFFTVIFIVFFFQITLGAFLGRLCSHLAWLKNIRRISAFQKILIFCVAFISIVLFRQLMARDALVKLGEAEIKSKNLDFLKEKCIDKSMQNMPFTWNPKDMQWIRKGGGPLGEPDFETLATGLMGSVSFLSLISFLVNTFSVNNNSTQKRIFSAKAMLLFLWSAAFKGFYVWVSIFTMYYFLTNTCILHKYGVIYRRWIFVYDFPHFTRFLSVFGLCIVYLLSILLFIWANSTKEQSIIPTNKN